ncbi:MAG: cytidylate kinase family protein [Candidatus Micrarchaeota archaeon]
MKIAISGLSGCGNSTACNLVSKALGGMKVVNYTFRNAALDAGLTLAEVHVLAKKFPEIDYALEQKQLNLLERENNCILGTRLAGWLLEKGFKVWLDAPLEVRAQRIAQRENKTLAQAMVETKKRDADNRARYIKRYSIDLNKHEHFDLVVNAGSLDAEQVAAAIVSAVKHAKPNELRRNPFPQEIKTTIGRKLNAQHLSTITNENVLKVIQCLQSK